MAIEIEHYANLDAITDASALSRAAQPEPYDRLEWLRLIGEHCPPPGRPLILRACDGAAEAWLPMMRNGAAAQGLSRWYSLRVGPAFFQCADGQRARLLTAIARDLRRHGLAQLTLTPMEPALAALVRAAFAAAGWRGEIEDATANWQVTTEGQDFDAYWAARPGRLRNTAKRKAKSAALDIVIHDRFDESAWADYEAVYRQSWKPDEGAPGFLRAFAEQEGTAGTARIGVATKDGRALAAQFWTVENGVATIHKLSHVRDADALSPGTILSAAMFRHVIERDRPALIDFGTGDDGYKAEWMDQRRMLQRVELFNPFSLSGLAGLMQRRIRALLRSARRKTEG